MTENKGKAVDENSFELQRKKSISKGVNEPLGDIKKSDEMVATEEAVKERFKGVFYMRPPLSEISSEIAKELNGIEAYKDADVDKKSYEDIMNEGLTFFMSSDTGFKRTGLLSLFPALLTGIRLYSEMSESKTKAELLEKIKKGIKVVFKFIYRDDDWQTKPNLKPVFDASPYEYKAFYEGSDADGLEGRSYIDSISWAVPLFLKIMNLLVDEKNKESFVFDKVYREKAKKLIKWCLDYVNGAVLTTEMMHEKYNKPYECPVGWNFSKIVTENAEEQRSLYFTYAAASMYLSLYEEYKEIIDNLQTLNRAYDKGIWGKNEALKDEILLKKDSHFKQVEKAIDDYEHKLADERKAEKLQNAKAIDDYENKEKEDNRNVEELQNALRVLNTYKGDKDKRRKLDDYYFFNEDKSAEFNGKIYPFDEINKKNNKTLGPVSRLKWNLEKISNDIWEKAKDKLEDNFVYDDFNFKVATTEAIQSGGQTNTLFAGLLHISICLYSKYDFVVSYTKDDGSKFADGSKKFGRKAYDNMQNIMLLHVQRAQRFFDKLSEKKKAFGVDFLILRFPENFSDEVKEKDYPTDGETAERLRKQLIRITSLTPMLLKTNNLISKYVVQYPQKQMGESLVQIWEKRFSERNEKTEGGNKKFRNLWESDGYHAMSNYYYVGALFDFYDYYKEYEEKYIKNLEKMKKELRDKGEDTKALQVYYKKKDDEIERLKEDYKNQLKNKDDEILKEKTRADEGGIGIKLVENISEVMKIAKYFDEQEFLKRIINGIRKQLAAEVFERYSKESNQDKEDLEKLKIPIPPKDDSSLFSLLQALATDIILQSAIEASKRVGEVERLGDNLDGFGLAEVAFNGGKWLIKGGINQLFKETCTSLKWDEIQKTKQES